MYLLEVKKNGSRTVKSSRGAYGHDYSDTDDNDQAEDGEPVDSEYDDIKVCQRGSCEGCSKEECHGACTFVFEGKNGKDKLLYQGQGKGKCVEYTCKRKEDCKNYGHSGFDCKFFGSDGYCLSECHHNRCSKCAETQCKELDWSCAWKENKCVNKPECKKDADCFTNLHQERCGSRGCGEGDLFCDKKGICERVVCDPAAIGGCKNCTINQCLIADGKDCIAVKGKSGEEQKCVSNTCNNDKDCRKLFVNDPNVEEVECKNGKCGWYDDYAEAVCK